MYQTRESVTSLEFMELYKGIIFVLKLQSNEAHIILIWILSILFSDFKPRGLKIIPAPPLATLTKFFMKIPRKYPSNSSIMPF